MANTPKKNRLDETAADQKLVDGFNKNGGAIPAIVIGGASVTNKDIVTTLQARIDTANNVLSTRAIWQAAVVADRAERDKTKTFVSGVKQSLLVAFAGRIDTLADFGLVPRKVTPLTPDQMVERTEKLKATRAARHTMGSKQKAAIKGTVAPTAPVNAAPTPTPPAAPVAAPVTPVASPVAPSPQPALPVAPPVVTAAPVAAPPLPASPAPVVAAPVTTPHA
jgi:hypothetical protein